MWDAPTNNGGGTITKYQIKILMTSLEDGSVVGSDATYIFDAIKKPERDVTILLTSYVKAKVFVREGGGDKPVWGEYSQVYTEDMPEGGT